MPALEIVNLEHRIAEDDLLELCHMSSVILQGSEEFWAKGLKVGFENDFISAIHLLVTQIENYVRVLMKVKGGKLRL